MHATALFRALFDSCSTVRMLAAMPHDPRRYGAIESERARAADLVVRYRASVDRLIESTTEGVL